jgi:cell division protein FtsX
MMIYKKIFTPARAHVLMLSFFMGGAAAFVAGAQESLFFVESSIQPNLKVLLFLQPTVDEAAAKTWVNALSDNDPQVESAIFVSREETLEKAQGNPALVKSLMLLRENPFPSSVLLRYRDIAWLERPEPAMALRSAPEVLEIRWDPEARTTFRTLRQWRMWLMRISIFALVILGIWCTFGVYRFWAARAKAAEMIAQLGTGLLGGGLALVMLAFSLRALGVDAALFKPSSMSVWPLLVSGMSAIATFGWKGSHEV